MLRHSLDEQVRDYQARWKPNVLGVTITATWLVMTIYSAIFLEFAEKPHLFLVLFFVLFPVVRCVTTAMNELCRFLRWGFGWVFAWMENLVSEAAPEEVSLPMVFTTTSVCLSIAITVLLFKGVVHLSLLLPAGLTTLTLHFPFV